MLELLAIAIVQLPSADNSTAAAVQNALGSSSRERRAGARVRAFADESGIVRDCEVISHTGELESGDAICRALEGKRVRPGKDVNGDPIGGFLEAVIWANAAPSRYPALSEDQPDAELHVRQMPEGLTDPFRISIGLIIDETGSVAACGPLRAKQETMASAACVAVERKAFPIVRNGNGNAIRYAQGYEVRFSIDPRAPDEA
jgi:hypothetical protein